MYLRRRRVEDADALFAAVEESRDRLSPWMGWHEAIRSFDDAREWIVRDMAAWLLRQRLGWGIFDRGDARLLGGIALVHPDWKRRAFAVSYWLRPSAYGNGYMREALHLVTAVAFGELGAGRVELRMDPRNLPSRRVAESCGYVHEGTLRRCSRERRVDGRPADVAIYSRISEDYPSPA
ncbi:MAG: GNAT family N-acetyltransferase [Chloroflexota bacterium]|nr:GNAT family N-acetyltransferase [Chloroflexota bacterium]